jgi:hypothetical protein
MSKRNDIHSPANLVTENYEYVAAFDTQAPGWLMSDWAKEITHKVRVTNDERGMNQCHHCGARIRYVAVMEHVPTGDYIAIGETCLENRFEQATATFQALRKAAELDRAKQRIKTAVAEFVAANPDLAFMADKDHDHSNDFVADVSRKLRQYGELSSRQVEAVRNSIVRDAERAAREAAEALVPKVPVVEGKGLVTGVVLGTKWVESDFGGSLKMLVQDDRGFKVWGTVPAALKGEVKGQRISFSATVEAKQGEVGFGFFKRPTKAQVLDAQWDDENYEWVKV